MSSIFAQTNPQIHEMWTLLKIRPGLVKTWEQKMGRVWGKRNKRKAWPVICEALSVLAPFPQAAFFLTSVPQHKLFEIKRKRLQCRLALVVWYLTGFFFFLWNSLQWSKGPIQPESHDNGNGTTRPGAQGEDRDMAQRMPPKKCVGYSHFTWMLRGWATSQIAEPGKNWSTYKANFPPNHWKKDGTLQPIYNDGGNMRFLLVIIDAPCMWWSEKNLVYIAKWWHIGLQLAVLIFNWHLVVGMAYLFAYNQKR